MAKKPKKQEYKASEAEKTNAAIAAAEQAYFQKTYQPLLRQMRDKSTTAQDRYTDTLQDRAQADTMQALTGGRPNLEVIKGVNYAANIASGAAGQMSQARVKGKDIATTMQTGVLGTARGQQADAATGLSAASRMATSDLLADARNKQAVRAAKAGAMAQVGGTFLGQYGENRASTKSGSGFMKPGETTLTGSGSTADPYKMSRGEDQNIFGGRVAKLFGWGG